MTLTYCAKLIRQQDSDRYLLSLFAPPAQREALWALYAFNVEISKTRYVVSETQIGHIRLQWWRDAINEIYAGQSPRAHYVLKPLAEAIKTYDLPQQWFNDLIYAREFDLEGLAPDSLEGLLKYCAGVNAPLVHLTLKILNEPCNDTVVVGISSYYGLIGTLRAVPYMLSNEMVMIPQDVLRNNNLTSKKLIDFNKKAEIPQCIKSVFEAYEGLRYDGCGQISSKFVRKMMKLTHIYERQIVQNDYDVFCPQVQMPPKFLALRLWLSR